MISEEVEIIEDFLTEEEFKSIYDYFVHNESILYSRVSKIGIRNVNMDEVNEHKYKEVNSKQFVHSTLDLDPIKPILRKLGVEQHDVLRCKVNFTPSHPEQYIGGWHYDYNEEMVGEFRTAVLYLNTNNGGTILNDGTIIESKRNRFASFPGKTIHSGLSHTGHGNRIVLNLNYLIS